MSSVVQASSSMIAPLFRAEMGVPDASAFVATHHPERKLLPMSAQELEGLQGDLVDVGQPVLKHDLKAALQGMGMLPSPEVAKQLESCDFGLVEIVCAFLPGSERKFVSARLETSMKAPHEADRPGVHDLFPQIVEDRWTARNVLVGADFRFHEAGEDTLRTSLVKVTGLILEPCMYGAKLPKGRAVWDLEAGRRDLHGMRTLFLIVQKPVILRSFTWCFRLFATLKTRWGALPVSVKRVLQGQETFSMDWPPVPHRIPQSTGSDNSLTTTPQAQTDDFPASAVRDLLLAAYASSTDFQRLFRYASDARIRSILGQFSLSDGLVDLVDKAIASCLARDLLRELLREVENDNPRQYAKYEDRIRHFL